MKNKRLWTLLSLLVAAGLLIGAFSCATPATTPTPTTPAPTTPKPTLTPTLTPTPTPTLTPTPTPTQPVAAKVFKYPTIMPLSGAASAWGIVNNRTVKMAMDDLGGVIKVGGETYKMQMIEYDSEYKADKAVDTVKRAVFFDEAKFLEVIGGACVKATIPITERNGVLQMACTLASKDLANPNNPLTFLMMINSSPYGPSVYYPQFVKDFGVKRLAVIAPDDETGYMGVGVIKEVLKAKQIPLELVSEQYFTRGTQDFTPVVLRLLAAKPDIIETSTSSAGDLGLFLKQLGEAGYKGLKIQSQGVVDGAVVWKIAGDYAVGQYLIGTLATPPTPKYADLQKRYEKIYSEAMSPIVPWIYEETYNLFKAIEKANTFDTMKVAYVFENMEWDGMYGHFRWGGTEPIFGFGIKRTPYSPYPMGKIGPNGAPQDWKVLGLD